MIRVQCWAYLWSARWLPGQWYCSSERAEHGSQSSAGARRDPSCFGVRPGGPLLYSARPKVAPTEKFHSALDGEHGKPHDRR